MVEMVTMFADGDVDDEDMMESGLVLLLLPPPTSGSTRKLIGFTVDVVVEEPFVAKSSRKVSVEFEMEFGEVIF